MTEEKKNEWLNFVGEYKGKKVQKAGEAKKFVLLFGINNSKFEKKVHVFENTLKTILEKNNVTLEELNYYTVSAVKNEYVSNGEKRFVWNLGVIKPATKEEFDSFVMPSAKQQEQPVATAPPREPVDWVKFANDYNAAMQNGGNAMHMLGAYLVNFHAEEFANIITLVKKNFEK